MKNSWAIKVKFVRHVFLITISLWIVACTNPSDSPGPTTATVQIPTSVPSPTTPATEPVPSKTILPTVALPTAMSLASDEPTATAEGLSTELDPLTQLQLALENLAMTLNYQVDQEYVLIYEPSRPESDDHGGISEISSCKIDKSLSASFCEIVIDTSIDRTRIIANSSFLMLNGSFWLRLEDEVWQSVAENNVRMPGYVDGIISPFEYVDVLLRAWHINEMILPSGTFTGIGYTVDIDSFLNRFFGPEAAAEILQNSEDFQFEGFALIGQSDERITEFSGLIQFSREGVTTQIQFTQTLSRFDEEFEFPDVAD